MTRSGHVLALGLVVSALAPACTDSYRVATLAPLPGGGGADGGGASEADAAVLPPPLDAAEPPDVPADARFVLLPPATELPSEASCAARVRRSDWEPRRGNQLYNQRVPAPAQLTALSNGTSGLNRDYARRVTGNFVGTTDEILQWGACKWGFDEDYVRSFAARASNWQQNLWRLWTDTMSSCPPNAETMTAAGTTQCAIIYGILQISYTYHKQTWPMIHDNTAFNVDYALAYVRNCFEGRSGWLNGSGGRPYAAGDEWGCLGAYYSGQWYDSDGTEYMEAIKGQMINKPWTAPGF
jgi:hypothetical protein